MKILNSRSLLSCFPCFIAILTICIHIRSNGSINGRCYHLSPCWGRLELAVKCGLFIYCCRLYIKFLDWNKNKHSVKFFINHFFLIYVIEFPILLSLFYISLMQCVIGENGFSCQMFFWLL